MASSSPRLDQAAVRTDCPVVAAKDIYGDNYLSIPLVVVVSIWYLDRQVVDGGACAVKRNGLGEVVGALVGVGVPVGVVGVAVGVVGVPVGFVVGVGVLVGVGVPVGFVVGVGVPVGFVVGVGVLVGVVGVLIGTVGWVVVGRADRMPVGCGGPATTGAEATDEGLGEAGAAEPWEEGGAWVLAVLWTTPPSAGTAVPVEDVGTVS
jgi:hypothetical protein